MFDDIFSRLDTIHKRDGQIDGQTDTGQQQRPRLRIVSRGKNRLIFEKVFAKVQQQIQGCSFIWATLYALEFGIPIYICLLSPRRPKIT